jgi:ketosteroid isomerase-like protein
VAEKYWHPDTECEGVARKSGTTTRFGYRASVHVEMTVVAAYRLEDRKIVEARSFWDLHDALEAVRPMPDR